MDDGVTTSLAEPWQLTYDDMPDEAFTDGLRLSTDCIARRLIEPLDGERYRDFPEHLGHRGHGFERIMQEWLINKHDVTTVLREIVVPWEFGESHLDLLIDPESAARLFGCTHGGWLLLELKANKDGQVRSENVRQVHRQMFAIERAVAAGKPIRYREQVADADGKTQWVWKVMPAEAMANLVCRVLVIDPTTWRVPDPRGVKCQITDDRRVELENEWKAMQWFMGLPKDRRDWALWSPKEEIPCTCGKCFRPTETQLTRFVAERAQQYHEAQRDVSYAKAEQDVHGDWIKRELTPHADKANPNATHVWLGEGWRVTLSKPHAKSGARSLRVAPSDAEAMPLL